MSDDGKDGEALKAQHDAEDSEADETAEFLKNPFDRTEEELQGAEEYMKQYDKEQSEKARTFNWSTADRGPWKAPSAEPDTSTDPADQHEDAQESEGDYQSQHENAEASGQSVGAAESSTEEFKPRRSSRIAARNSSAGK